MAKLEHLIKLPKCIKTNKIAKVLAITLLCCLVIALSIWFAIASGVRMNMNVFEIILLAIGGIPLIFALLLCIYSLILAIGELIYDLYWRIKWRISHKKSKKQQKPKLKIFTDFSKKAVSKLATITEFVGVGFVMTDDKEPDDGTPEQKQELFVSHFGGFFVILLALCMLITSFWCSIIANGFWDGIKLAVISIVAILLISFFLPFIVRLLTWPLRATLGKKAILKIVILCLAIVIVYSGAIAFCVTQCIYAVDPSYDFSDTLGFDIPDVFEQRPKYSYYIGNIETKKYHEPNCSYLPYPKNRVNIPIEDIDESQYRQYSPCKHCNP